MAGYNYGPAGYSQEFTKARELAQAEERRRLEEQREANAAARASYLAQLEGERAQQVKRSEQRLDAELEPVKTAKRREWLSQHPDQDAPTFERVWRDHLRAAAVEELNALAFEATKRGFLASGRYQF